MSVTGGILAGVGLAGSIGSAAISSNAAGNAANTQANAADYAAQLQAQEAQNALNFQEQQWNTQQQNLAPWLSAGKSGLSQLQALLNTGQGGLLSAYPGGQFQAPTLQQAEKQPGYQFAFGQGLGALQNSAAAKGNLLSGNTLEALNNYAQDFAQQDYNNVYNQALQGYNTNYNVWANHQADEYNRLAGLAGVGQTAANTLGQEGQAAAQNVGNISLTTGAQQGQDYQNAAAARASGYVGSANAWSGALGGATNNLTQLAMLNQLYGGGGGGSTGGYDPTSGGWA